MLSSSLVGPGFPGSRNGKREARFFSCLSEVVVAVEL